MHESAQRDATAGSVVPQIEHAVVRRRESDSLAETEIQADETR